MHNIRMTIKYKFLPFLFACIVLVSCIDDDLLDCIDDNEIPEMFTDGYSLNMMVTLDKMGGTRAVPLTSDRGKELEALESYIDPEKFRVLFFDRQERFLFESKSRWVKKIQPTGDNDHSEWFVAVPLYAYGNDESEDWDWEEIRRVLTGEDMEEDIKHFKDNDFNYDYSYDFNVIRKVIAGTELQHAFKVAILANRPEQEWNMGIYGRPAGSDVLTAPITDKGWYIKNGPIWKKEHTRWGDNPKTVFDLHHCQYDPVYDGKNYNDREVTRTRPNGTEGIDYVTGKDDSGSLYYTNQHVYDFIAGEVKYGEGFDEKKGKPTMGATSTWIDWSGNDGATNSNANKGVNNNRYFMPPTEEHPIPMYGIQNFNKLENWVKGTPFNLSKVTSNQDQDYDYKAISLLRSVVKLELVLPSTMNPYWVALIYSNVYARCEPMNVWDPTNEIWDEDNTEHYYGSEGSCEWYNIRKYGATTRSSDSNFTNYNSNEPGHTLKESVERYQQRMSWFYGAWSENGPDEKQRWDKLVLSGEGYICQNPNYERPQFPKVFNSCVQRVGNAICHEETDKRRNRPYGLLTYPEPDGQHYVVYTGERNINDPSNILQMGAYSAGAPVVCYWQVKESKDDSSNRYSIAFAYKEEQKGDFKSYKTDATVNPGSAFGSGTVPTSAKQNSYEQAVQFNNAAMPWPLVRNHVYKITITAASNTRSAGDGGLSIKSEDLYSKSIKFNRLKKEKKETEQKKMEKE